MAYLEPYILFRERPWRIRDNPFEALGVIKQASTYRNSP